MTAFSNPKWKLPNIPLDRQNPKLHPQSVTPLPTIHLSKDVPRRDSTVSYLHVKNYLRKYNDELAQKRVRCQDTVKKLSKKWANLEFCENRLRNLVIAHNKFVRNNLEKRLRANARLQQNQNLKQVRQSNIDDLKKEMDVARSINEEFKIQISKHVMYDDFLTKLVEKDASPFKTVYDLLKRFEMLVIVKDMREKEQEAETTRVLTVHQDMKDMIHSRNVVMIGFRNELNDLRCRYEDICRNNLATENLISNIVNKTNELKAQVSSCQYTIDAIYRYVCLRRRIPVLDFELRDVKPRIDVLKSTLGNWEKILLSSESIKKIPKKSYGWKPSVAHAMYMWKKKPSSNQPVPQKVKKVTSLLLPEKVNEKN